jgi:foldase protein PrsA
MKNKNYQTAAICGLLLCLLAAMWGCGSREKEAGDTAQEDNKSPVTQIVLTTGFDKDEVFRIGKSSCSRNEFMVYLTNIQNRYESVYGSQIWSVSSNGVSIESRMMDSVAARIAQVKTMNLLAEEYQVTLTEDEEKQVALAAQEYYSSLNEAEIETMGASEELITQLYREYLITHKVYVYIIRDINPEISDDEARNVTVDWIFLRSSEESAEVEALAKDIKNRLDAGEDFNTLASLYSDDKTLTHTFGKDDVDQAIEDCAFNLAVNETSDVIKGTEGYYIIHCESTLDRQETDTNKEKIITQRKKEAFNEVYGTFADSQVQQLNETLWEKLSMTHREDVTTDSFFDIYEKYFSEE